MTAIAIDSRKAGADALFVALRGEHTDGHRYIDCAIENGATVVVMQDARELPSGVTSVVVPDTAAALSVIADRFFDQPSGAMLTIGITGTNGKTTTAQMVGAILNAAGIPSGTIGTLGADFSDRHWNLSNTTPLAPELHQLLAQMRDSGARGVAMEVSSHALALQRVNDVRFRAAALTNVTRDHLDFHKTPGAYAAAKRVLFEQAQACVFNADDALGAAWAAEFADAKSVLTYGLEAKADVIARDIRVAAAGSTFAVDRTTFTVNLPGRFNVANALAAIAIARTLDISDRFSVEGLANLERVAGRMQHQRARGIDVVVDYAHTPDALSNALTALRETATGSLLLVFGCGGDRDQGKRRQMGEVAEKLADRIYVTSDNPRSEDPQAIIGDIVTGLKGADHRLIVDRREAIERAITDARSGDVVLIAGKGHETYQLVGEQRLPFDDSAVAAKALAARGTSAR
ncbi:MAG: UDP-N-acetylmuramoyl-L-alanyl-D-glutamate--2,6-diaminopimelate ligase [Candidatus Eremiobacteraeota bacterium]|nr:UDP-N-acetylmuramoyl-L-alanyl-D-glutamate--2,6-diaminopimelate ligase [Candidatus Eremiobacteraeota bacterium]